jgi:ABC-2 type transport system permease protein
MSGKTMAEQIDQGKLPGDWRPHRETAPSVMRADDPTLARWLGLVGLMLVTLGGVALLATVGGYTSRINPLWGTLFLVMGLALLLFHAAVDGDMQIRRTYGVLGYAFLGAAILFAILPLSGGPAGAKFIPYGLPCLVMALLFLLPFARNETEPRWREIAVTVIGGVGLLMAGVGFIGGNISETFMLGGDSAVAYPYGLLLILAGLAYLWAFLGLQGTNTDLGYRAGLAVGAIGAVAMLVALGRSIIPPLFHWLRWIHTNPQPYFVPTGLVLTVCGFLYAAFALGLLSENRFIVLFRRELSAFFYSPIAYIVLFGFAGVSWFFFMLFVAQISDPFGEVPQEPIIRIYLLNFFPIICLIFAVPVLTMRLLSEEHRTGTFEVLLTAPLSETAVVLSKFLAAWVFYMMVWLPWGICLIALRVEGQQPFEYRPLLIFYIMQACTGAGFLAMGLFFSSLTRNQIIAAILTFMGMLLLTLPFFVNNVMRRQGGGAATWSGFLTHISYIDLWISSLDQGTITPKFYLFPLSAAVFWLFAAVKVLESRRWR